MKSKRKLLSMLLAAAMVFSLGVPALADEGEATPATPYVIPADISGKLVILHTNDTHGADLAGEGVLGTAAAAQLKQDYEAAGASVLLLSAGDAIQGAPIVNLDNGASEIAFMNAAGYDAMSLGNHEFDWGTDNLKTLVSQAKFPVLAANILVEETGKPLFEANQIFETSNGLKVGVFGLDTPEAQTKVNPTYVKGLTFLAGDELYKCAQAQVDELKAAGCDVIIALGHLGVDPESEPNRSIDVLSHVTGIDVFIDGHSHSDNAFVAEQAGGSNYVNGTLLVSTGTKLAHIGVVTYDGEGFTFGYADPGAYTGSDPTVAQMIEARNAEVDEVLSKTFAQTEVTLDGSREPGVRTQETNLGDFATDAILWAANQALGEGAVDAAITNGGGIRDSIKAGNVTMKDMKTVFPFGNTVATVTITGAQLLEALEAATCSTPTAIGAFPQVSGISFTIDVSVPYENGAQYPSSTYFAPANPGARIKDVQVNGKPLDLTREYVIATNDFTAVGGDTYYVFSQGKMFDTTVALEDALVSYTKDVLGGVISAARYGQPAGRIQIVDGKAVDTSTTTPEVPSTQPEAPAGGSTYTVQAGDSLWSISQKVYGTGTKWNVIYDANKGIVRNPSWIQVGQVLQIPAA